jgi:hypothetical protein
MTVQELKSCGSVHDSVLRPIEALAASSSKSCNGTVAPALLRPNSPILFACC